MRRRSFRGRRSFRRGGFGRRRVRSLRRRTFSPGRIGWRL